MSKIARTAGPEMWMPMGFVRPEEIGEVARDAEADGWDGLKIYDTQCLFGDVFVMTTAAALATTDLRLSLSTSNPVTRHPSVAAGAIASVAAIAGPRVMFGVGRGDSALAYVGRAPAPVELFERFLEVVRAYLQGGTVTFDALDPWAITPDVSTIPLGHVPDGSSLKWLDTTAPPVPIEVYATGPRVLRVGGRQADRIALGLGADVDRLRWAIDVARTARQDAGLDPATLSFSAIVPIGVFDDMERARRSVSNMVSSAARFAVINGSLVGPADDSQRKVFEAIGRSYDMSKHGLRGAQDDALTDDFVDRYAIVGSPARCVERVLELQALGIDAMMLSSPQGDAEPADMKDSYDALVGEVIPAVRASAGS